MPVWLLDVAAPLSSAGCRHDVDLAYHVRPAGRPVRRDLVLGALPLPDLPPMLPSYFVVETFFVLLGILFRLRCDGDLRRDPPVARPDGRVFLF